MADARLHVTCQEVVELVTDHVEQALLAGESSLVERHLGICDGCDRYVDQIRATIKTVGHVQEEHVPDDTRQRLLAAFRDWRRA